jgi:hypothetical protein
MAKLYKEDINVTGVFNTEGHIGVMIAFNVEGNVGEHPRVPVMNADVVNLLLSDDEALDVAAKITLAAMEGD